ncbi:MAG TPA: DUF2232 domain-containing protein [Stellaceae bacterium]|nr:DUF2232 domain-containing protein [Stellaceae bacterium]
MSRLGIAAPAVLCGAVGAGFYLTMLTGSPGSLILISMAQLPLFAAGLWLGAGAAALAALAATGILLAATGAVSAAFFAAVMAMPVVVLVRQALLARTQSDGAVEWYPPGLLAGWLTGLALFGTVLGVVLAGGTHGIEAILRRALGPALDRLMVAPGLDGMPDRNDIVRSLALVLPGMLAVSWMAMVATNGILAQGVLARFGANRRPSPDIAALGLPPWMPLLFAAGAAAASFDGPARPFGVSVMILLFVPFCLAGLAVLHTAARRLSRPLPVLVIFYVLAALLGWPLLLTAVLGFVDGAFGLRRRFKGSRSCGGKTDG